MTTRPSGKRGRKTHKDPPAVARETESFTSNNPGIPKASRGDTSRQSHPGPEQTTPWWVDAYD